MNVRKTGKRIARKGFTWIQRTEVEAINNTDPLVVCQSTIVLLREKRKIPSIQERWNLARFLMRRPQKQNHNQLNLKVVRKNILKYINCIITNDEIEKSPELLKAVAELLKIIG